MIPAEYAPSQLVQWFCSGVSTTQASECSDRELSRDCFTRQFPLVWMSIPPLLEGYSNSLISLSNSATTSSQSKLGLLSCDFQAWWNRHWIRSMGGAEDLQLRFKSFKKRMGQGICRVIVEESLESCGSQVFCVALGGTSYNHRRSSRICFDYLWFGHPNLWFFRLFASSLHRRNSVFGHGHVREHVGIFQHRRKNSGIWPYFGGNWSPFVARWSHPVKHQGTGSSGRDVSGFQDGLTAGL